jgi:hypothetical protein
MLFQKHARLILVVAGAISYSCGGGGGDSGDSNGGGGTQAGVDSNDFTPTTLAISLPTTLTNSNSNSGLRLQTAGGGEATPGTSESQGYWELTDKVRRIQVQLAELSLNNAVLDNVFADSCGGTLEGDSCTVQDACATITAEILKNIELSMGEEHFAEDGQGLDYLKDMEDTEHCFDSVTVTALSDDSEGYDYEAVMVLDSVNSVTQYWNSDRDKVKVIQKFQDDFSEAAGGTVAALQDSSEVFKGTSTFVYNDAKKLFKARNTYSHSFSGQSSKGEEKFTIQSLSDKLDVKGVVLKGSMKSESGGSDWSLEIEGKVDNNGGFVRTLSGWSQYQVSSMTISAPCEVDKEYGLYPAGTTAGELEEDAIFFEQLGTFFCMMSTTNLDSTSVYLYNQLPSDPTGLAVMEISWPEFDESNPDAAFYPTVASSSLSISSLSASPTTNYHCYEEQFSATGELDAWRAADGKCDDPNISWISESGSFGDDYFYDESEDGDAFQETKVSISGVTESSIQDLSGMTDFLPNLYLAKAGSDFASKTPFTEEFDKNLIGMGWAEVPDASASTSGMDNYQIDYWGAADQAASAEVYVESYDQTTGEISVTRVSDATVQAQE